MKTKVDKLAAFIPILIGMFSISVASSQIVYTDVNPDVVVGCSGNPCYNFCELDLNNDGITDFKFDESVSTGAHCASTFFYRNRYVSVVPLNQNKVTALRLTAKQTIDASNSWSTSSLFLTRINVTCDEEGTPHITHSGDWSDQLDYGYLALTLQTNAGLFYGWVHLKIEEALTSPRLTIFDYAYNSNPNQSILSGEGSPLSVKSPFLKQGLIVYPNPFEDVTQIAFTADKSEKISLNIYDLEGRLVKTLEDNVISGENHLIVCNAEKLTGGIYLLQLGSSGFQKTIKLVVAK